MLKIKFWHNGSLLRVHVSLGIKAKWCSLGVYRRFVSIILAGYQICPVKAVVVLRLPVIKPAASLAQVKGSKVIKYCKLQAIVSRSSAEAFSGAKGHNKRIPVSFRGFTSAGYFKDYAFFRHYAFSFMYSAVD